MAGRAPEELFVKLRARPVGRAGEGTRCNLFPLASLRHIDSALGLAIDDEKRDGCFLVSTPEIFLDTVVGGARHRPLFFNVDAEEAVIGHSCCQCLGRHPLLHL
jgi:hypothetical protein